MHSDVCRWTVSLGARNESWRWSQERCAELRGRNGDCDESIVRCLLLRRVVRWVAWNVTSLVLPAAASTFADRKMVRLGFGGVAGKDGW